MTRPSKRDQVSIKYTLLQNGTYVELCIQYLHSAASSCKILLIELFIDGKISLQCLHHIISYDVTNLKMWLNFICPLGLFLLAQSYNIFY